MSAPDGDAASGPGSGPGRYVILDLCGRSGRIRVISPDEDPGDGVRGEGALIRKAMALGPNARDGVTVFRDFPLPALLEEEEEDEEEKERESLGSSGSLDGCELSADGESDVCNGGDEDAEEIDALLASTGDDDEEWADDDSLKVCGRSKRGRIRQTFQRLRSIVGPDRCMDAAAVFDEAIRHLKALQLQVRSQDSHDDLGIAPDG